MISLKSGEEIVIMQEGGRILKKVLKDSLAEVKPGVTLASLDKFAERKIHEFKAEPSFKKVPGYNFTICSCVNDVVVHGIPTDYVIKEEDIVGIDCGVYYKGFHTDAASTIKVKSLNLKAQINDKEVENFLSIGNRALLEAIKQVRSGNYIYDISQAIQNTIENAGYSVVRTLVGHGIGKNLHEEPEVPGFIKEKKEKTVKLNIGMVLAIEVIYNMGTSEVRYKGNDGWTIATKDGKISGLFEKTVALTPHGSLVLT